MKMWATCVWTVRREIYRRSPICGLDSPSATRAATACSVGARDDIGHLADVAGRGSGHDERVEVRISLDTLDPPVGRVRVIPGSDDAELRFTGWLGLLRVLYQVMGSPGAGPHDTEE